MTVVCGVDGCPAGWIVVSHDLAANRLWWRVLPSLEALLLDDPDGAAAPVVIALDMPIGLTEAGPRACDVHARRKLGQPRGSSVFPAPIRPVLNAASYAAANALRRAVEGKGMSKQAWAIVPKIMQVDATLRGSADLRFRVREVHPEVCFWAMNGERPMAWSKKRVQGRAERADVLGRHFGAIIGQALATKPAGCHEDDLLDAFAATWTAGRIMSGKAIRLPADPPRDGHGLPMEMVY